MSPDESADGLGSQSSPIDSSQTIASLTSSLEEVQSLQKQLEDAVGGLLGDITSAESELAELQQEVEQKQRELTRELQRYLDLEDIDTEQLDSFIEKPYTIVPRGENEALVIVPRWIPFNVGWLERQDESYNHFVVNKYVNWISELPDEIQDSVGISQKFEEATVTDDVIEFADEAERDRAWDALGGRDGGLYRRQDDSKIQIKSGKEFEVIAELIENGNLPFSPNPIDETEMRATPADISLRPYQERAWEKFIETGMIGVYWPPGAGKTFLALYAGDRIPGQKLVVVPQKTLEEQWTERINEFCSQPSEWDVRTYQYLTHGDNMAEYNNDDLAFTAFDECVSGDTTIETRTDGLIEFETLAEQEDIENGWNNVDDLEVKSYDKDTGEYFWDTVTGFYKSAEKLRTITLANGETFKTTTSHPHLLIDGDSFRYSYSQNPTIGDYLLKPAPNKTDEITKPDFLSQMPDYQHILHDEKQRYNLTDEELQPMLDISDEQYTAFKNDMTQLSFPTIVTIAWRLLKVRPEKAITEHFELVKITDMEIDSKRKPVYDIETESHHFIADGFFTHNCHRLPAKTYSKLATLNTDYRMGLTASPYREEEDTTKYIFALTGFPVGLNWDELVDLGVTQHPDVRVYLHRTQHQKLQTAKELANDPGKMVFFCDEIEKGKNLANELDAPFVYGETTDRLEVFRNNRVTVSSRVGDEGMSLPEVSRVVEYSFHGGSRRQELQRAGRVMHNDDENTNGEHIVLMTDEEHEKYGNRLYSLEEKGFNIQYHRHD